MDSRKTILNSISNCLWTMDVRLGKHGNDYFILSVINRELEEVDRAEKAGRAFVIRPQKPVQLKRLEKD